SSRFLQPPPNNRRPANRFLEGKETLCPINWHHQHRTKHQVPPLAQKGTQADLLGVPKAIREAEEEGAAKGAVQAAPEDRAAAPAGPAAAESASISARRKSAVFASNMSTSSTTRKSRCSSRLCKSGARFCLAA